MLRHPRAFIVLFLTAVVLCGTAGIAQADVGICLGNGTYKVYHTDKTCADFTIGPIIRKCTDLGIANPGGGNATLGDEPIITGLHPVLDGQPLVGVVSFVGAAVATDGAALSTFLITRTLVASGDQMQVLGFDNLGNIYIAIITVANSDAAAGNLVIGATAGGEEIPDVFDITGRGTVATGSVTITVDAVDPADDSTPTASYYTEVNFDQLTFNYFDAPVANEVASWGGLKAAYR